MLPRSVGERRSPLAAAVPTENVAGRVFKNRSERALNPGVGWEMAEGLRSLPALSSPLC